jgi:hypothetical protein
VLKRHYLPLGDRYDNAPFLVSPYGSNIILAGSSGGGKTTFTAAFMEILLQRGYQFIMIDPEGDYLELQGTVTIGDVAQPPALEPLMQLLERPHQSVIVCTLALSMEEKPAFLQQLLAAVLELRQHKGRPHWILLDEAHHLAPAEANPHSFTPLHAFTNYMAITTKPELLHQSLLDQATTIMAVGQAPHETIHNYASCIKAGLPEIPIADLQKGEALVWHRPSGEAPFLIRTLVPQKILQRHKRKYAIGDMGPDSFIFTGPETKLHLKASNLLRFVEIAEGVDDDTWLFHLQRHDYSTWMRNSVNDETLAEQVEKIEDKEPDAVASRDAIAQLVKLHYTGPA